MHRSLTVPVAERPRRLPAKQQRQVRLLLGTLNDTLADQRSGRHALTVEIKGSNPFQGTNNMCRLAWRVTTDESRPQKSLCKLPAHLKWPVRLLVRLPVLQTGQRGSKP